MLKGQLYISPSGSTTVSKVQGGFSICGGSLSVVTYATRPVSAHGIEEVQEMTFTPAFDDQAMCAAGTDVEGT